MTHGLEETGISNPALARDAAIDRDEYNAFVGGLSLAGIEVVRVGGERTAAGAAETTTFELTSGYRIEAGAIHFRFDVVARPTDEAENDTGRIHASVVVSVQSDAIPGAACIQRFAVTSASLMAHPYLREAIATTAQRLGFSGVLLPIMTSPTTGSQEP